MRRRWSSGKRRKVANPTETGQFALTSTEYADGVILSLDGKDSASGV